MGVPLLLENLESVVLWAIGRRVAESDIIFGQAQYLGDGSMSKLITVPKMSQESRFRLQSYNSVRSKGERVWDVSSVTLSEDVTF